MQTCRNCNRPVADCHALACVDCGAVLHEYCALAKIRWHNRKPDTPPVCDGCFVKWLQSIPPLLKVATLADVARLAEPHGPHQ